VGLSSEHPMHFCEGKAELFPLGDNVFMPGDIIFCQSSLGW
jgi:hypothetical protein